MLADRDPPGGGADWLQAPPTRAVPVTWECATMDEALAGSGGGWQLIHLSNILDWLDPDSATRTLDLAARALAPDGRLVIRQLNSTLDIPALAPGLAWDAGLAARLHAGDRSFFYNGLHVGGRR
jgi:S-adenosylmethionine-diacylglycerol 3-amino-3-carboxypropyl transferase